MLLKSKKYNSKIIVSKQVFTYLVIKLIDMRYFSMLNNMNPMPLKTNDVLRSSFFVLVFILMQSSTKELQAQTFPYTSGNVPDCMTSDSLKLSTGVNWVINACYGANDSDQYWQIASGPGIQDTVCATVWAYWQPAGGWVGLNCPDGISRAISNVCGGDLSQNTAFPICPSNNPYIFIRRFFVNSTTPILANLSLGLDVDDGINEIKINGNTLPNSSVDCFPDNTSSPCDGWEVNMSWLNIILQPGENTLAILVENRNINIFQNLYTTMGLNVDATLRAVAANNVFVKNEYFMPNSSCYSLSSTLYPPIPTYTQNCVTLPSNTGQITVTNYSQSFQYAVSPTVTMNGPNFNATAGTVYTISASNALSCSATATATLVVSPALNVSLSNNFLCLPSTPPYLLQPISVTGGTAPYSYSVSPNVLLIAGNLLVVTAVGTYTLTATDVNNCVSTTTLQVGNEFDLSLSMLAPCVGKTLTAQVTPALPNITYSLNGGTPQAGNTFTINAAGVYTVTATDPWGCTSMSTIQVFDNPQLQVVSDSVPCYPTFTVLNNSGAALVQSWWINPFNLSVSLVSVPPLLPTQFSPDPQFPIPPPFNYTVTAVDVNGCSATATQYYEANPFCCNITSMNAPNSYLFSTAPAYNNATTNDLLTAFGNPPGNIITTSDYIVIDNPNFVVDQDITFLNCPNLLFAPNTQLRLAPNTTLTIDGSTLKANCEFMWKGIAAYNPDCQVIIKNSTLKDMEEGVFMKAGAKLDCQGSTFLRNLFSIQFIQTPLGYNNLSGSCIVWNNYFGSNGANLFFPHNNITKGECGIHINESREVEIGELFSNNQVQFTNKFENLYCGILITSGSMLNTETYNLYNNEFVNIKSDPATIQWKMANYVSTSHGAGIFVKPIYSSPTTSNHILNVKGQGDFMAFVDCDKAIAGSRVSGNIEYQIANNCLMGFMFADDDVQKYDIHHNSIGPSMVGMQFIGNVGGGQVYNNSIGTLSQMANPNIYPIGINVNYNTNSHSAFFKLVENQIQFLADAGAGFNLLNTGSGTELLKNTVFLGAPNPVNVTGPTIVSAGISANNCKGTAFRGNHLNGTMALLGQTPNALDGMELIKSPSCILECNHFNQTRIGLRIQGNCGTGALDVKGNTFFMHGRGMWFDDILTDLGGLGIIGSPLNDNYNTFSNSALFGGGYGIWRESSLNFSGLIFTNQFLQLFSDALTTNAIYDVLPNSPNCTTHYCQPALALMAMQNNIASGMSVPEALAIVYNSNSMQSEIEEVSQWMREQELVAQLELDSSLLQSNIDLQNFYVQQMFTSTKELRDVENNFIQLKDSLLSTDSIAWNTLLLSTDSINNSISSSKDNVKLMSIVNRFTIKWLASGISSFNQTERDSIKYIADLCPFVGGLAVYRARMLYNNIEPMAWADRVICNALFSNKNEGNEDDSRIDESLLALIDHEGLKLYPNPASTILTLEYNLQLFEKGELVFYDLLGREYLRVTLSSYSNKVSFPIDTLPKGLYLCKYFVDGIGLQVKKIIVE